jgi:hypothetical protein
MDLMKTDGRAQRARFDLGAFASREQRRMARLVRAAYGVGHTHTWFLALPRADQEAAVREWAEEALTARAVRLGHIADVLRVQYD